MYLLSVFLLEISQKLERINTTPSGRFQNLITKIIETGDKINTSITYIYMIVHFVLARYGTSMKKMTILN